MSLSHDRNRAREIVRTGEGDKADVLNLANVVVDLIDEVERLKRDLDDLEAKVNLIK
jgi:hypothetical protein